MPIRGYDKPKRISTAVREGDSEHQQISPSRKLSKKGHRTKRRQRRLFVQTLMDCLRCF